MNARELPCTLLALCALSCGSAQAQDARVSASLQAEDPVWVGQQVKLVVELLAPGYFASAASFDLPDPEGVLLMPPLRHPVVGNETIDGTLYTVQRHVLSAWPMRAGEQSVPSFSVGFRFKRSPLDHDGVPASVTTTALPFTVKLPPGSENLGTVISARSLTLEETWDPEPGAEGIKAGAGFKRTVTFTAPDVPGMVFPPFPAGDIDGLGVYAKRRLLDQQDRGSLTGVRREEITYVCKRPGQFTIPAVKFSWFDIDSRQLRTEELPARTLNVIANPALASADVVADASRTSDRQRWTNVAGAMVIVLLLVLAGWSRSARGVLTAAVAPFRPVRLQPLNPTGGRAELPRRSRRRSH